MRKLRKSTVQFFWKITSKFIRGLFIFTVFGVDVLMSKITHCLLFLYPAFQNLVLASKDLRLISALNFSMSFIYMKLFFRQNYESGYFKKSEIHEM